MNKSNAVTIFKQIITDINRHNKTGDYIRDIYSSFCMMFPYVVTAACEMHIWSVKLFGELIDKCIETKTNSSIMQIDYIVAVMKHKKLMDDYNIKKFRDEAIEAANKETKELYMDLMKEANRERDVETQEKKQIIYDYLNGTL